MVRVIDPYQLLLAELLAAVDMSALRLSVSSELSRIVCKRCPIPEAGTPGRWRAQTMSTFLEQAHHTVEEILYSRAATYSKVAWLWYSRRLPAQLFRGSRKSTAGYVHALFDAVTGTGGLPAGRLYVHNGAVVFPLDAAIAETIANMACGVLFLYDIQVSYRIAGKGIAFQSPALTGRHGVLPVPDESDDAWLAVRTYDSRHEVENDRSLFFATTGTVIASSPNRRDSIACIGPCQGVWLDFPIVPGEERVDAVWKEMYANYSFQLSSFSGLADVDRALGGTGTSWLTDETVIYLIFARLAMLAINMPYSVLNLVTRGYIVLSDAVFDAFYSESADDITEFVGTLTSRVAVPRIDEFRRRMSEATGGCWPPLPHPVIRTALEHVYIDFYGAALGLRYALEYPAVQGDVANVRGSHFETQVQRVIDSGDWRPRQALALLRGRTLRRGGRAVTDIDAIGERGSELLLISCKSIPYSREYDRGAYTVVRNAASLIEKAVASWSRTAHDLFVNPVGDNYDLSAYSSLVHLVVTPFPVFSRSTSVLEELKPGLRRASSVSELQVWLMKH